MKHEKQQRFSIRKYAVGAASVLIGFAFQAQTVAADGVTPTTTENQPTIHTVSDSLNHPKIGLRKHLKQSFNQKLKNCRNRNSSY